MNYGYNENSKGWKEDKKLVLANCLHSIEPGLSYEDDGINPYIEVDGAYGGVRIRRITHLSDKHRKALVKELDRIYDKVMGNVE